MPRTADRRTIETNQAEPLFAAIDCADSFARARLRDDRTADPRHAQSAGAQRRHVGAAASPLRLPTRSSPFSNRTIASAQHLYDGLMGVRPLAHLEPYFEAGREGRVYSEVNQALMSENASSVRVNEQDKLVISVAVPIRRFATLYGVLMLTTESGDIDDILKAERTALVEVFAVAFVALLLSAVYLAGFIAQPILRLAAAAERVRRGRAGRYEIPAMEERNDESANSPIRSPHDAGAL
jgi:hypothetical protein